MHPIVESRHSWVLAALVAAMAATRFHHEGGPFALPDASLAAFFLAGLWLEGQRAFWGLLAVAGAVDYLAVTALGVSDFCIGPAYAFLVPTYGAMWWGGRLAARRWRGFDAASLAVVAVALLASCALAFLISDGAFQVLSGKTAPISLMRFLRQSVEYFPVYASATGIYALCALALRLLSRQLAHARPGETAAR
jgi:hypothetical protein